MQQSISSKQALVPNPVAQRIVSSLLKLPVQARGIMNLLNRKYLASRRKHLIRHGDPNFLYQIGQFQILIPISHELPFYLQQFPNYGWNVARLAAKLAIYLRGLAAIDIGANIGDTAAMWRSMENFDILCIEGNPKFLPILRQNLTNIGTNIDCAGEFVGSNSMVKLTLESNQGTARLIHSSAGASFTTRSLPEILIDHPKFQSARLLKIDTDGFDIPILQNSLCWLEGAKPIIFFEYDPHLASLHLSSPLHIFSALGQIGYEDLIVYDNTGDYLLSTTCKNIDLIEEIHLFYSGRNGQMYCDIAVFPKDMAHFFLEFRKSELRHFTGRGQVLSK